MRGCLGCLVLIGLLVGNVSALEMVVAPHVLSMKATGEVVTIHTDVPYDAELACSLTANGGEIGIWTFSDACGDLVVQCSREDVFQCVGADDTTVTFLLTVDGEEATVSIAVKR